MQAAAYAGAHRVRGAIPGHTDAGSSAVNLGGEHCRLAERHLHSCGLHLLRSSHAQLLWEGGRFQALSVCYTWDGSIASSPTGTCTAVAGFFQSSCAAAMLSSFGKVSVKYQRNMSASVLPGQLS